DFGHRFTAFFDVRWKVGISTRSLGQLYQLIPCGAAFGEDPLRRVDSDGVDDEIAFANSIQDTLEREHAVVIEAIRDDEQCFLAMFPALQIVDRRVDGVPESR